MPRKGDFLPRGFRVYKATNRLNGNIYIGMTQNLLCVRKSNHHVVSKGRNHTVFSKAINKHGFDNFEFAELYLFDEKRDAEEMERMLVSELNPAYNVDIGGRRARPRIGLSWAAGESRSMSQEHKEKIRQAALIRWARKRAENKAEVP